jgi:hypothetical protein
VIGVLAEEELVGAKRRHVPAAPLLTVYATTITDHALRAARWTCANTLFHVGDRAQAAAELFGVTRRTILRWSKPGARMGLTRAERICFDLGRHPSEIWGAEYWVSDESGL